MKKLSSRSGLNKSIWPVYIKNPINDISSLVLDAAVFWRLNNVRHKFQIQRITDISNFACNPVTKVYLKHKSYNCGAETHFIYHNGNILGSIVIDIAQEQISNWKEDIYKAKVVEFLRHSLTPLDIVQNDNPDLFVDNYSFKTAYSLFMEMEGEDFSLFVINIYLDLSQELARYIPKV